MVGFAGVISFFVNGRLTQKTTPNAIPNAVPNPSPAKSNSLNNQTAKVPEYSKAPPLKQIAGTNSNSKAAEFDALVKSGKPSDAFAAYKLLLSCSLEPQTCGDLTAGQRTQAYHLLNQAVAAHLPTAAVYLLITTPDGRAPYEVYGDPAYDDWRANARREVEEAANREDKEALSQMFSFALNEKMQDKALMYFIAYADMPPAAGKDFINSQIEALSQGLAPDQAAAAIAEGHSFNKRQK